MEVDLDAIRGNVAAIAAAVAPAAVCAVVKADGYGHGDVPSAEMALEGGAEWLAVALVEEGIRLREAGIRVAMICGVGLVATAMLSDSLFCGWGWKLYFIQSGYRLAYLVVMGAIIGGWPA